MTNFAEGLITYVRSKRGVRTQFAHYKPACDTFAGHWATTDQLRFRSGLSPHSCAPRRLPADSTSYTGEHLLGG